MEGFIKETGKQIKLSGIQKAAILLGELGPDASAGVIENLHLTPRETKKIVRAMKKLGKYKINNPVQVQRELMVLTETANYGIRKGIYKRSTRKDDFITQNKSDISNMISSNPDAIANLLRSWLGD